MAEQSVTSIDYWPCVLNVEHGCIEEVDNAESADFWGVYIRNEEGFAEWIYDTETQSEADELASNIAGVLGCEVVSVYQKIKASTKNHTRYIKRGKG
jgi:hypothetical protein